VGEQVTNWGELFEVKPMSRRLGHSLLKQAEFKAKVYYLFFKISKL
jgi:hypothetical protein